MNRPGSAPGLPPGRRAAAPPARSRWPFGRLAVAASVVLLAPLLALALIGVCLRVELDRPVGAPRAAGRSARPDSVAGAGSAARPGLTEGSGLFLHVPHGSSFRAVTDRLRSLGWIRRSWVLRLEARRRHWDRRVTAGWYPYHPGERIRDLLGRLSRGEIEEARITIPEGWRCARILPTLADSLWMPAEALEAVSRDARWLAELSVPGPGIEGYIVPDTYRLPRGDDPQAILGRLVRPGIAFWEDSLRAGAERLGLDRRATWTLASIVEAEAASPAERRIISAVFLNRLRLGMRLESDPTVLYALGRPPGRVLNVDLEVDSPYNTYRRTGLPPGPICSPGRASLRAAVDPQPGCNALFFVARGDGTHVFSRSLAEHKRARGVLRSRAGSDRPRRNRP